MATIHDTYIGQQVRTYRRARGMSQLELADLTGVERTYISKIENGRKPVDSRTLLNKLADALSVTVPDLTQQHTEPTDRQQSEAQSSIARIQQALIAEGTDVIAGGPRPVDVLNAGADRALLLRMEGDYVGLGQIAPGLISDLYAATTANPDDQVALLALSKITFAAAMGMKELARVDLAWNAAMASRQAAEKLEDGVAIAAADFVRSQVSLAAGAVKRASGIATSAVDALTGDGDQAMQVRGMLHLQAALCLTAEARRFGDMHLIGGSDDHAVEAGRLAAHTGEGRSYELRFGPTNVGVWRLSLAMEREEPGRVPEIAATIDESKLDTAHRRARFYIEQGRAYAKIKQYQPAVTQLLKAEKAAPLYVRTRPVVRELTGYMLRDAQRRLAGGKLGEFAVRVGAVSAS
jgi:transcriptional regulator with XRE-family HTH domain